MNETIKLIRFDGVWIISEVEEIPDVEFGDPDCVLKYPYEVDGSCVGPFPPYSRDREFIVRSSEISLIADPSDFLYNQYRGLVEIEKPAPIAEESEE
jgi:hypothetical protein